MENQTKTTSAVKKAPTADEIEAFKARQEANAEGSKGGGEGAKIVPISAAKMDNIPELVRIGTLKLNLRAVPIKLAAKLSDYIEESWPAVLIYAALGDEDGSGIGYEATAAFWSEVNARNDDPTDQIAMTTTDVAREVKQLSRRLISESTTGKPAPGYETRVVDAVADATWMLADQTPGLTREALPDLLEEHLTVPQYADLLRAIWLAVGSFPNDQADRFGSL